MYQDIRNYCAQLEQTFDEIAEGRKKELQQIGEYVAGKIDQGLTAKLIVICTHNSRRSHLGQVWLAIAAEYYGLPTIETYSGGTAATAFYKSAVNALQKIGCEIAVRNTQSDNPTYEIKWAEGMDAYSAFSKTFDDAANPSRDFGAIMVCNSANEACPVVLGADFRIAIPYIDPKAFDGTDLESEKYEKRCEQIGREMLYALCFK